MEEEQIVTLRHLEGLHLHLHEEVFKVAILIRLLDSKVHHLIVELQHHCHHLHLRLRSFMHHTGTQLTVLNMGITKLSIIHKFSSHNTIINCMDHHHHHQWAPHIIMGIVCNLQGGHFLHNASMDLPIFTILLQWRGPSPPILLPHPFPLPQILRLNNIPQQKQKVVPLHLKVQNPKKMFKLYNLDVHQITLFHSYISQQFGHRWTLQCPLCSKKSANQPLYADFFSLFFNSQEKKAINSYIFFPKVLILSDSFIKSLTHLFTQLYEQ